MVGYPAEPASSRVWPTPHMDISPPKSKEGAGSEISPFQLQHIINLAPLLTEPQPEMGTEAASSDGRMGDFS